MKIAMTARCSLLVAFLLLSIATVYAQPSGPPEFTKHSEQQQTKSANAKQETKSGYHASDQPAVQIDRNINPIEARNNTDNSKDKDNENASTNRGIMWATIAIAIAAAFQLAAMLFQYCAMRRQIKHLKKTVRATEKAAEAARKSAEALPMIERAYLFLNANRADEESPGRWQVKFAIRNEGKTPAILTQISARLVTGLDCPEDMSKTESIPITRDRVIVEGRDYEDAPLVNLVVRASKITIQSGHRTLGDQSQFYGRELIFHGIITYEDIFRESHVVKFCLRHDPTNRKAEYFQPCDHREHNDYT